MADGSRALPARDGENTSGENCLVEGQKSESEMKGRLMP